MQRLTGRARKYSVEQALRPEAHRVVGGQPRLGRRLGHRAPRRCVVKAARVQRDGDDRGGTQGQRDLPVQLDQLGERRQRVPRVALDLRRSGTVAEHERVWGRAVDQPERHARVRGMRDRPLALYPEQAAATLRSLDDELLGGAGEEVRDDRVDGDAPAGDRDPGLAGRDELRGEAALPGRPVELERHRHLPDGAVGADGQDDLRRHAQVLARGDVEAGRRLAKVSQLDAAAGCQLGELGTALRRSCSPFSTSRPPSTASRRSRSHSGGKRPPCVATPTSAVVGPKASPSSTEATTGMPSWVSPARDESTIATVGVDA